MFREIINILMNRRTVVDEMNNDFIKMLKIGLDMFVTATDLLYLGGDTQAVRSKIFPADKKLNKIECDIRSKVVTHVSVSGTEDFSTMLIFMSIVKDAERIGDYIKNIYDITLNVEDFRNGSYGERTLEIRNRIVIKFEELPNIFKKASPETVKAFIEDSHKLKNKCEEIITELLKENSNADKAVAYALILRYYKRILAHISNIATAKIMPLNRLDFFDEDINPVLDGFA